MNRPYLLALTILALVTAGSLTFGIQQYQRAERLAREAASAASAHLDQPGTRTRASDTADAPTAEAFANNDEQLDGRGSLSPQMGADTNEGPQAPRAAPFRLHELMEDPEFAAAWQAQQKAALDGPYAPLFRKLNLTPQQVDRLKTLLAERSTARMDVMSAAREQGFTGRESRDEIRTLMQATQAEIDASIREVLGEQGFSQLQQYERTAPQRTVVNQLESRLSYSSAPLTSAQSEALVNILAETSGSRGRTTTAGMYFSPGSFGPPAAISDSALVRAQAVLSPDQLAALRQIQADQQAQQNVQEKIRERSRQNRPPPPPRG